MNKIFLLINKISNNLLLLSIFTIFSFKMIFMLMVMFDIFSINLGGGSDAVYYHRYAIGEVQVATTIWPEILRFFYENSIYSRKFLTLIIFFISVILIPFIVLKLTEMTWKDDQKFFLLLLLVLTVYPSLYIYSLDIYRDVFMVLIFLITIVFVKKYHNSYSYLNKVNILIIFALIFFLYELREYLGISLLLAFFISHFRFSNKMKYFYLIFLFLLLFLFNYLGYFSSITEYREGFEEAGGSTTIGLNFNNPLLFIPNYILSFMAQVFGFYLNNPLSILVFFLESLPFIFCFFYLLREIDFNNNFLKFLFIFFIIYCSVWVIGNDNLGTAVRLRIFNYLVVYIAVFYIIKNRVKSG